MKRSEFLIKLAFVDKNSIGFEFVYEKSDHRSTVRVLHRYRSKGAMLFI